MLTINMLGKAAIYYKNQCLSEKLSNKLVALVCLLVLYRGRDVSKEKLISYLWPDSDDEAAKSNLRFNLWSIKKAIPPNNGEEFILTGKDFCRINENYPYQCDKTTLDASKISLTDHPEDLLRLKGLFKGDFLEGFYLKNCDELNEMILFERVVCQNKQVEILEKLVSVYEEQERYEEELPILNEIAALEPFNEQVAYRTVRIYGLIGNRTAAMNYYKNFEIVLRRNLNTSPNSELKELYRVLSESSCGLKSEERYGESLPVKTLKLSIRAIEGVEYYGIAKLVEGLSNLADRQYIAELDRQCLKDLNFICGNMAGDDADDCGAAEGAVPAVRIVLAFQRLITHLKRKYVLQIDIENMKKLDPISRNLIRSLQREQDENLTINLGLIEKDEAGDGTDGRLPS